MEKNNKKQREIDQLYNELYNDLWLKDGIFRLYATSHKWDLREKSGGKEKENSEGNP